VRALLDTRAFLWWTSDASRISERARALIEDPSVDVLLSTASAWEIAIKVARGRLELPRPPERYVPERLRRHRIGVLEVGLRHALRAGALPAIHADPFDRLLVAQAQLEGIPILTADPAIAQYEVETVW
jgi:PIN domain nuclease of toxin-antitoxin system